MIAGWSSLVARRAHNPKVAGSNPAPATLLKRRHWRRLACRAGLKTGVSGQVAQVVEHAAENRGVGGSTPSLAIRRRRLPVRAEFRGP